MLADEYFLDALLACREELPLTLASPLRTPEGQRVAEAGAPFDRAVADAVRRHRIASRELRLDGSGVFKRWELRREFARMLEAYPDVAQIHEELEFQGRMSLAISRIRMTLPVGLHLALMQVRYPRLFDKTLLGAWLAGLTAMELGYSKSVQQGAFEGALYRDLGMLYVAPEVLGDGAGPKISGEVRTVLKQHLLLSTQIVGPVLLESHGEVLDAIMGHHERVDGHGYPARLVGSDIPPAGRLVAFADVACAIRLNYPEPATDDPDGELAFEDVHKVLLLDQDAFDPGAFAAFTSFVQHTAILAPGERRARQADFLAERTRLVATKVSLLEEELARPGRHADFFPVGFEARARKTLKAITRSGHGHQELEWWLKVVAAGREEADEQTLHEVDLQQREVLRQLERLEDEMTQGDVLTAADVSRARVIG